MSVHLRWDNTNPPPIFRMDIYSVGGERHHVNELHLLERLQDLLHVADRALALVQPIGEELVHRWREHDALGKGGGTHALASGAAVLMST